MSMKKMRKALLDAGIVIGMDNIGRCADDVADAEHTEFFGILGGSANVIDTKGRMYSLMFLTKATLKEKNMYLDLQFSDGTPDIRLTAGTFTEDARLQFMPKATTAPGNAKVAARRMPKTLSELNDLFPLLYPDYKEKMYYDVMRERECIDLSMLDPSIIPGKFMDFSEEVEYKYYDSVERRLRAVGCEGGMPAMQVKYMALLSRFYETKRNKFKEWLTELEWDHVPRIDTWFQRVFNATAPPLEPKNLSDIYLAKVARAWFMGAIARMDEATVHEIVPVLIGGQGMGKTSGLRYTAAKPEWFIDTVADVTTPQGIMKFLDCVRGRLIVELAESTQIRSKDQEALKAHISMKEDQYRKPYLRRDNAYPRHFIMAASSNLDDVFTDLTGNRRYYPIYCHRADLSLRTQYDVEQVWAEAYVLFQAGEHHYISADWQPAMMMQDYATAENSNVSAIEDWLDNPNTEGGRYAFIGATVTKDEVFYYKFGITSGLPAPQHEQAWKAWARGTHKWRRMDYPIKSPITHKSTRGYVRVATSDVSAEVLALEEMDVKELRDFCIAKAEFAKGYEPDFSAKKTYWTDGMPLDEVYKSVCHQYKIRDEYSPFPILDLPPSIVVGLQDAGYIYYDRGKGMYRTALATGAGK